MAVSAAVSAAITIFKPISIILFYRIAALPEMGEAAIMGERGESICLLMHAFDGTARGVV